MSNYKVFPPEIVEYSVEKYFSQRNKGSNIIYRVIVLSIIVFCALLPFISVDITVQSRGVIRSKYEQNKLVSVIAGEVERLNLKENKYVKKGDTLVIFKTGLINEQIALERMKLSENEAYIADLKMLLLNETDELKTKIYLNDLLTYQYELNEIRLQFNFIKNKYKIDSELYGKKVIAKEDFEYSINKYELLMNKLDIIKTQKKSEWITKLKEYELLNKEYRSQIKQLIKKKELYYITAPISGTIINYSGIKPENFIVPNQQIAVISPNNDLIVECYVKPSDIGLMRIGMKVDFQLDAFNYNQWGFGRGSIFDISNDVVIVNGMPVFKVYCKMHVKHLYLRNGYKGELKKGMTLTGRFKLIKRTLFNLLYDKMDNWLNPMVVPI